MESFSDCSSIAPVMTSLDERQGDGMCEANGELPGGLDKCSDDLLPLYVDTKTDMLALVEEDLKLKLDIRSFKEDFRDVLVDFESYLEREAEFDTYWRDLGSPTGHGYRKHAIHSPRRHSSPTGGEGKRKSRSRRNRESKCYSPRNLFPERSGSRRHSMRQRKHHKQKYPSDGERFVEYVIDNDPSRINCSDKANSSLGEISSITKCSDFSLQEQHGDLAGLLHSTLNMEYNVSPTHAREPVQRRNLLAHTPASQMENLGHRPTPQGKECSESKKPMILQADHTPVRNSNPQSSSGNYSSSLDESTPIVRLRTGRRRSRDPRSTDEDSGLCHDSLTPKVKENSRGNEMFLDEMAREDRYLFDRREVNQTEAPLPPGFLEQPRHISERRTADGASFNTTYTVSSTTAHRHSQADVSDLTTLPSDSMQSSDITMSSMHFSPMTSCVESSYKESDANTSPSMAENMTQASGEQSMPGMYNNIRYRELVGGNFIENSGGSSLRAEIYPGHLPYSDTTGITSDSSTQARFYRVNDPHSHGYAETSSGEQYYKPGYAPYSSMVSSAVDTSSGPCVPVNSLNNTNATSSSNVQYSDVSSSGQSIGCLPISTSARNNIPDMPNHPSVVASGKSPPSRGGDIREKPPLPIPRPQCIAKHLDDIYVDNINVLRQFPTEPKMDDVVMEVANTNTELITGEEKGSDSDKQGSKKAQVPGKSMGFFKRIGSIRRHFRKRSKSKAMVADSDES